MDSTAELSLSNLSAQVAAELAAGLSSEETLRERFNLSEAQWEALQDNPVFKRMLHEAQETLSGPLNAKQRIRLKAGIAFEETIPTLYRMIHDRDLAGAARMEAAKLLAKVSEVDRGDPDESGNPAGNGFSITINLGETSLQLGGPTKRIIEHAPVATYEPNNDLILGVE